jgi:ribulose-phosphate 3-epimerase
MKATADICPTITASDQKAYRTQMDRIAYYALRTHIDLFDGTMTDTQSVKIEDAWWPGGIRADLHLMCNNPFRHLNAMLALRPQLIIVHAEAKGGFVEFAETMHAHGVEAGIALLPDTPVEEVKDGLEFIDHVLIFSGHLGHYGGEADLSLLDKVRQLKDLKPQLEIGWDGGINDENAADLIKAGVEVLNVGGFIQHAPDPRHAYDTLEKIAQAE